MRHDLIFSSLRIFIHEKLYKLEKCISVFLSLDYYCEVSYIHATNTPVVQECAVYLGRFESGSLRPLNQPIPEAIAMFCVQRITNEVAYIFVMYNNMNLDGPRCQLHN